jgi:hypothetical protein
MTWYGMAWYDRSSLCEDGMVGVMNMRRIEGCRWETECYEMSVMRVALKQGKKQWTRVEDEDWMWSCRAADVATCKTPNTRDREEKGVWGSGRKEGGDFQGRL